MNSAGTFTIHRCGVLLLSCLALASAHPALGQFGPLSRNKHKAKTEPAAAAGAEEQPKLIVRVYPVDDLLLVPVDYPLPTSMVLGGSKPRLTSGGMGGGMGGGAGGGMGGGMFSVTDQNAAPEVLRQFGGGGSGKEQERTGFSPSTAAALTRLIKTYVKGDWDPDSESDTNDQCTLFGKNLIVRQTEEGQRQVAELLKALRSGGSSVRSVTVDATWLALDSTQRDALRTTSADSAHGVSRGSSLDPKRFHDLIPQAVAFRAHIVCLNGQKVHLTTGTRRVISVGATPTVGVGATGYTTNIDIVNVGAALQVTPSISGDRQSVFVDLRSAITHWGKPGVPVTLTSQSFAGSSDKSAGGLLKQEMIAVDRPNIGTVEWSTTASIPLGVPVLIGSATLTDPDDNADKSADSVHRELSLVIEVHAN